MSTRRSGDLFSEVIVGIFMVAILALLGYFTIVISGVDILMGREKTTATVTFTDVGGLKERDNVVYRGMKVGTVEKITLVPHAIKVQVAVDSDVVLREKCHITVAALSLLGGNYMLLEEGEGKPVPLATGDFKGDAPIDWMRELGKIAHELSSLSGENGLKGIVTNVEETAANINQIVARVERGEGMVGKLLSKDETIYDEIKSAATGVRQTFDSTSHISARLERGEGTLGKLLSTNDAVFVDLRRTIANASEISDRIVTGQGTVGQLFSTNDEVYVSLRETVANLRMMTERVKRGEGLLGRLSQDQALADNASELLANLKAVSARLEKGEGTLGKLTNDAELYNEVNAVIKDVRQVIDNYRDTTPISSFAGLVGGAL